MYCLQVCHVLSEWFVFPLCILGQLSDCLNSGCLSVFHLFVCLLLFFVCFFFVGGGGGG